jgi:glycosyltransferase involved in cell wall biosynthesis
MIKICFVVPRAYYLFNPNMEGLSSKVGGSQKQAYLLSAEIAKNANYDVHFCVADFDQPEFEIINNVKISKSFSFSENKITGLLRLFRILKRINADFYIFRAAETGVALSSIFIRILLRKKVFYMLAHNDETRFMTLYKMLGFFTALIMPFTYKFAHILTAQTQSQFNQFYKSYKRKPDAIIGNIVEAVHEENQIQSRDIILWVGRLVEFKNPELFIELAMKFPDEKFVMIAPQVLESSDFAKRIKMQALKLVNLDFIQYVHPHEMKNYYHKAKIYIITSESEGFSNTLAEASAHGCAVLSYKINDDCIFDNHRIGICAGGNKTEFFDNFKYLIENNDIINQMGLNGKDYFLKHYNKEKIVEKLLLLLQPSS